MHRSLPGIDSALMGVEGRGGGLHVTFSSLFSSFVEATFG